MGKYVCKTCNSENVEQKVWIDLNTELTTDSCSDEDIEDNWCRDCTEHCEIEFIEDEKS